MQEKIRAERAAKRLAAESSSVKDNCGSDSGDSGDNGDSSRL
jgi:hypothetical protein